MNWKLYIFFNFKVFYVHPGKRKTNNLRQNIKLLLLLEKFWLFYEIFLIFEQNIKIYFGATYISAKLTYFNVIILFLYLNGSIFIMKGLNESTKEQLSTNLSHLFIKLLEMP